MPIYTGKLKKFFMETKFEDCELQALFNENCAQTLEELSEALGVNGIEE